MQDELVRRIARELQEAGVGVQETSVGTALNRHRHRAGQKGLRKPLFGHSQRFLNARAFFDLLLQLLRAFAHHPVQILQAQLRLAAERPFPRQRMRHLQHLRRVKRLLEDQQAVGLTQPARDVIPGIIRIGGANDRLQFR